MAEKEFSAGFMLSREELAAVEQGASLPSQGILEAQKKINRQIAKWGKKQPKGTSVKQTTNLDPVRRRSRVTCTTVVTYSVPAKQPR